MALTHPINRLPPTNDTAKHTVESILAQKWFYEIPKFQRWYSWGPKQIREFLEDIASSLRMTTVMNQEWHSFGSIEATKINETHAWNYEGNNVDVAFPIFLISDGQQRITTMFIFWFAVCHYERNNGRYDMFNHLQKSFFRKNTAGDVVAPFLKLQEDELDNGLKQLAVNGHINAIPLDQQTSAVHKMRDAYNQIYTYISDQNEQERNLFYNQIMIYTEVILIFGLADPHIKFEVRNNRGMGVSQLDRAKNLIQLIGKRTAHGRFEFADYWYESLKQLDLHRLSDKDDELFGHALTMYNGTHFGIGKYSTFKDDFVVLSTHYDAANQDHTALLNDLERFTQCFNDMTAAYHNVFSPSRDKTWRIYGEFSKYIRHRNWNTSKRGHLIAILSDICVRLDRENVFDSNILAMYHSIHNPDDFIRCLRQLEKVVFRVYKVRGKRTDFGKEFRARFAREIYEWPGNQPDLVNKILSDLCNFCINPAPHAECTLDSLFVKINRDEPAYDSRWSLYFVFHWQIRKYKQLLLRSVTKKWQKDHNAPDEDGDRKNLFQKEHIMPKTGWMAWKNESDRKYYWTRSPNPYFSVKHDYRATKHFLGNLVMSKEKFNVIYSNHPYKRLQNDRNQNAKKSLYLQNRDWSEVRSVARNYDEWNRDTIKDRQERMARWAIKRWKLECDADCLEEDLPPMRFIDEHSEEFKRARLNGAPDPYDNGAAQVEPHAGDDVEGGLGIPTISEEEEGYDFPEDFYTDEEE